MNQKIKNVLGVVGVLSMLLVATAVWNYTQSYGEAIEPSSFRSFSVTGEAKVVAVPDVAVFTFSVITEGGKDIAALQKQNTDKMNQAIAFAKEQGVDAKDIQTQSYNLNPRYTSYDCYSNSSTGGRVCPPATITGYTINQIAEVKVRDFSKIGDIMAGVVEKGANSVSDFQFTIDEPATYQNLAKEEAIAKAKAKAEMVAKAAGFSVGRLLGIDDSYYAPVSYTNSYLRNESMGVGIAMDSAKAIAPSIEAGSQEVKSTVTLRYEIK